MNHCIAPCVVTVWASASALVLGASADGAIVLQHLGTANPATEGWSASTPGPGVVVGPTSLPAVAWSVQDPSGADGSGGGYSRNLTPCQTAMIASAGWTMRVCLSITDGDEQPSIWYGYDTGSRRFDMWFTTDASGRPVVQLMSGNPPECGITGTTYTVLDAKTNCHVGGFHLFELVYSASAQAADLYVDGVVRISGYPGHTVGIGQIPGIAWGAGSSCADGAAEFRLVQFEVPGFAFGDLNCDGHVNGLDLAMLLAAWTGSAAYAPCPPLAPADLNADCKVNGLDLAMLLAAWG